MTQKTFNKDSKDQQLPNFKIGDMFVNNTGEIWMMCWDDNVGSGSDLTLISLDDAAVSDLKITKLGPACDVRNIGIPRDRFYQVFSDMFPIDSIKLEFKRGLR